MRDISEILELVQLSVFVTLGAATAVQWWRRRSEAAAWLAATFGGLALVVVVGQFLPEHSNDLVVTWARKITIALIVLFPFLLYRFMASFAQPARWINLSAATLTGAAVAGALLFPNIPEAGDPRSTFFQLYVYLILIQWSTLSAYVSIRLWRESRGKSSVARRRMRTLSIGALGLAGAIVLAGIGSSSERVTVYQVVVQLLAIVSGPFFLLGFAPPSIVRRTWRRPEEREFRKAELELMEAMTAPEVASVLLPHMTQLVGGRGSLLLDRDRKVIGSHGLTENEAGQMAGRIPSPGRDSGIALDKIDWAVRVPLRAGWLVVAASPYTPFFGQEETEMLQELAVLAELCLARVESSQRQQQIQEQLTEAQAIARVGSWEWEIASNLVTASEELYRILGVPMGDLTPTLEALMEVVHPLDQEAVADAISGAVAGHKDFSLEYRIVRPGGGVAILQTRGRVVLDEHANPQKMIGVAQDVTVQREHESFREQFIADAAHELRTPIASLLGFTEILSSRRDQMSEEQADEIFQALTRAGTRLKNLVANLLDLNRLQQGKPRVDLGPVPLSSLCQDALTASPVPSGTEVELQVPNHVLAVADPQRLHQVVSNLLVNAYRYGGPSIVLGATEVDETVVLSVTDDGPGVQEDLIPHLFDPFARGETSAGLGGSGLGLAIVQALVNAFGGKVWYEPAQPSGARFSLRLRKAG